MPPASRARLPCGSPTTMKPSGPSRSASLPRSRATCLPSSLSPRTSIRPRPCLDDRASIEAQAMDGSVLGDERGVGREGGERRVRVRRSLDQRTRRLTRARATGQAASIDATLKAEHERAVEAWRTAGRRRLSLVDCVELRGDAGATHRHGARLRSPLPRSGLRTAGLSGRRSDAPVRQSPVISIVVGSSAMGRKSWPSCLGLSRRMRTLPSSVWRSTIALARSL